MNFSKSLLFLYLHIFFVLCYFRIKFWGFYTFPDCLKSDTPHAGISRLRDWYAILKKIKDAWVLYMQ